MKKNLIAILFLIPTVSAVAQTTQLAPSQSASDSTKVNQRDRNPNEMTADQQMNSSEDLNITQHIRQNIMKEKNFSTYAQNVKIITMNGKVTLKGPVRSEYERNSIVNYARLVVSPSKITNEMSVVTAKK